MDPRKRIVEIIAEGLASVAAADIISQAANSSRATVARERRAHQVQTQQTINTARETARSAEVSRLQAAHPQLVSPRAVKGGGLIAAARNIRTQLKARWPHVKFSVRTDRFSMGDAIDVKWTDGPTTAQVDAIVNRYAAGSFDGMTDCYDYRRSAWTDAFGDAKYVHTSRDYSPAVLEWARQRFGAGRDEWNRDPAYAALQKLSIARVKA